MRLKFFIAFLLLSFVLAACSGPASTEAPAAPSAPAAVEPTAAPAEPAAAYPVQATVTPPAPVAAYPAEPAAPPETEKVQDALGRPVNFASTPQRCALVGRGVFMVADAVYAFPEASQNLVAIASMTQNAADFISMIDPAFSEKETIDRSAGPEQIAALQPDCVILKTSNESSLGKPLEELQLPLVYVDFETPEQFSRDLKTLGAVFNNPARAEELNSYYQTNANAVTGITNAIPADQRPDVLLVYYDVKDGAVAFNVAPQSWMQTLLIEMAGGRPVWTDSPLENSWTTVSMEQIAAWNPDVVIVTAYSMDVAEAKQKLLDDPQWQALDAVKNGKLYGMASDVYTYDQPDTRWIMGLKWISAKLHPESFPDFNLEATAAEFYKSIYNMDDAAFQQKILPLLKGD